MRLGFIAVILTVLCGCTTVQIPDYIKADHPYVRKIYGDYDKITSAVYHVLARNGWKVHSQTQPSVYERPEGGRENTEKDLLLFSQVRQHSMILYSSYTHLNAFIHATADGAEVELRYGKVTPLVKQFRSNRNDQLVKRLLTQIEQEVLEGK